MCGVVGYIGGRLGKRVVLEGLKRLEYRGYDSSGLALLDQFSGKLRVLKAIGQLDSLQSKVELAGAVLDGHVVIGHTRWATHGGISEANAHPHVGCKGAVAVVHNGIIENHADVRQQLIAEGHEFTSSTDTEVIAHVAESINSSSLIPSLIQLVSKLRGAYACLLISEKFPDTIIAIRKGSPLCIAAEDGGHFVASDAYACSAKQRQITFMPDESFALVSAKTFTLYDFQGKQLVVKSTTVEIDDFDSEKNGYQHYMLKEIYQQKAGINQTLRACQAAGKFDSALFHSLTSICLIGAGTSWHAGKIAQFFFEQLSNLPTTVMLASEFRYTTFFPDKNCLYILVSQSGETADTLECLRLIKSMQLKTLAITNVASSTVARESDAFLLTKAGQEIAVASTKAFSAQLVALFWFAQQTALHKGLIQPEQEAKGCEDVLIVAEVLENLIAKYKNVIEERYALYYAQFKRFIFLGRHISYPFALEAALKLKEITYVFAQGYPAGELKHGPIALLDKETPVILFSTLDEAIYRKILSNAQEVKARDAHLVVFMFEGQQELYELADCAFIIPRVNPLLAPLAMTGLMQFFAYQIAKILDRPIDKPRNLAKSVTVE